MKVIFVNGSSHASDTTMQAVREMQKIFSAEEAESEVIQLGNQPIRDYVQCGYCGMHDAYVFRGDAVNQFATFAKEADGFVFATPVYYTHPGGHTLAFLDQVFYSVQNVENPFAFKPSASIAIARRGGATASFDMLNKYFGVSQMPVVGSTYQNISHGPTVENTARDEEGIQAVRNLVRNMVWVMRSFALAREQGIPCPETEGEAVTNFIQREG